MDYDPRDNEVIHLLKKLKYSNGVYPPEMLAVRRQGYLKQVAQVSAGAGLVIGLMNIAKGGKGAAGLSSAAGKVIETLLVVALLAEAGVVTYFNRGKLAEYFRSITRTPNVENIAAPPVLPTASQEIVLTLTPIDTSTVSWTETLTPVTPIGTPSLELAVETARPDEESSTVNGQSVPSGVSTNVPNSNTDGSSASTQEPNGNNGNHYGQTPKPERTKEHGNNTSSTQSSSEIDNNNNKNKP